MFPSSPGWGQQSPSLEINMSALDILKRKNGRKQLQIKVSINKVSRTSYDKDTQKQTIKRKSNTYLPHSHKLWGRRKCCWIECIPLDFKDFRIVSKMATATVMELKLSCFVFVGNVKALNWMTMNRVSEMMTKWLYTHCLCTQRAHSLA